MTVFFILLSFAVIAGVEVPGLIKRRHRRDLTVYTVFFAIALAISLLLAYGVAVPSPIKWCEYIIRDVLHLNYTT